MLDSSQNHPFHLRSTSSGVPYQRGPKAPPWATPVRTKADPAVLQNDWGCTVATKKKPFQTEESALGNASSQ